MKPADQTQAIRDAYEAYRVVLKEFAPPPWEEMAPKQKVAFETACGVIMRAADPSEEARVLAETGGGSVMTGLICTLVGESRMLLSGERVLKGYDVSQAFDAELTAGATHFKPTGRFRFELETAKAGDEA